jgi:hypothetical protein
MEGLEGGCIRVLVTAGQAIMIPSGMIYLVQTLRMDSIALSASFLSVQHMKRILREFVEEREEQDDLNECFPCTIQIFLLVLMDRGLPWLLDEGLLHDVWMTIRDIQVTTINLGAIHRELTLYYVSIYYTFVILRLTYFYMHHFTIGLLI